jgi:flagellar biosynthesis protein FliP
MQKQEATGELKMAEKTSTEMQKFIVKQVPEHRLELVERILKNDSCADIQRTPEGTGNFTVTALCPLRKK